MVKLKFNSTIQPLWSSSIWLLLLTCYFGTQLANGQKNQPESDDEIRSVIVLVRHGVRAPIASEIRGSLYNAQPWPMWPVAPGVLTHHGIEALRLLGEYYRLRYPTLLRSLSCGNPGIYVEANTTQRTIASAKALLTGMAPECSIKVHFLPGRQNPLFSLSESSLVDQQELIDATDGKMANRPSWFTNAFAMPLSKIHDVLMDCSGNDCDKKKPDFRTTTVKNDVAFNRPLRTDNPVDVGADFAEHFLLEYTEGMPMNRVGWGRVSREDLNELMEMNTRYHDFILRTPYSAQVAASDLAARIRDTIMSSVTGNSVRAQLGTAKDHVILLVGHDANLSWLGGLLRLEWLLPDQTFNATPPGSALVFEVHRNRVNGANTVQVFFISQTLDQMRYLLALKGSEQPSIAPIFVPGCSGPAPGYACSVRDFAKVVTAAVDNRLVESDLNHTSMSSAAK